MPSRPKATKGMKTAASNDETEYKPTFGAPSATIDDTLIRMIEYLKKPK